MSGRSASSVRELLGKFEENSQRQRVSPPSRGRSPVGSESAGSRPLSKVRTSFVAVERSGQMAPSLRKLSNNFERDLGGDGQVDPEIRTNNGEPAIPMANVNGVSHPPGKDTTSPLAKGKEEDTENRTKAARNTTTETPGTAGCSNTAAIDSDKPVSAATDDSVTLLSADPKDEKIMSEGGASLKKQTSLGDLLKGHAFDEEASSTPETTQTLAPKVQESAKPSDLPSTPKARFTDLKVNGGQPVEANTTSPASAASANVTSTYTSAAPAKKDTSAISSAPTAASATDASTSPKSPKPPQGLTTSSKQQSSRTALPKQTIATKPTNKITENHSKQGPAQRSSRPSAISKPPTSATTISSHVSAQTYTSSNKKTGPTSPLAKAQPKSPTRPVRLPASLTAPTAASVAKLGAAPPTHSPNHTSSTITSKSSAASKDRKPAVTSQVRPKASRTSLPASAAAPPKPKARASIAGSKPADGGFLARMMRPTQSSASKTHDKIEPKTPPKKAAPSRPHKVGEGASEHGMHESVEGDPEASEPPEVVVESPHLASSENAREGTNLEANAVSGETFGANGEDNGINGDGTALPEAVST